MSQKNAKVAAKHHTTLNTFALVVSLLEAGGVYDPASYRTKSRIIALCKAEEQRQLRKYDAAIAKVAAPTTGKPTP